MPNKNGLHLLTPTSISVSSGTGTINANGSVTFTGCDTIRLNGIFSSSYDNYQIVMRYLTPVSGSGSLVGRMRLSGTDNSAANSYTTQDLYANSNTKSASRSASNFGYFGYYMGKPCGNIIYVHGPYLAQPTVLRSNTVADNGFGTLSLVYTVVTHNQSTAYDGISLGTPTAFATLNGLLSVYGMRN